MYIDYKHSVLLTINILKYGVGTSWDWDTFRTITDLTSLKASVLVILFMIVPFISIKIPVPLTTHVAPASIVTNTISNVVNERIKDLDAPLAITLMAAAVFLPQALFWYAYPIIMLTPSCLSMLSRFVDWVHAILASIPVLHVVVRATAVQLQTFGADQYETEGVEMRLGNAMGDLELGESNTV